MSPPRTLPPESDALVSLAEIRDAQQAIAGRVHRTPVMGSTYLGNRVGARVVLKLELFQKTGSFKPRGILNTLRQLSAEEKARGVISLSTGNHAQALAWGATASGMHATIVMPATASRTKIDATRGYGGEVVLTEGDLLAACLDLQRERRLTLVHPFDDPRVIAGQGTVGLEILDDVPGADVILVACGGGGLLAGVAAAIKSLRPSARVIGIEPEGASAMSQSVQRGEPVRLTRVDTIADGLAAPFAGRHTFAHVQALVAEMLVVTDQEIAEALGVLLERCKLAAEPAAAAAIVPLLTGRLSLPPGTTVVPIICGGNVDRERLKSLMS